MIEVIESWLVDAGEVQHANDPGGSRNSFDPTGDLLQGFLLVLRNETGSVHYKILIVSDNCFLNLKILGN